MAEGERIIQINIEDETTEKEEVAGSITEGAEAV